jgi:predicted amidohydrolase
MPSSAKPLRIALLQYGIAWCDPQANFALVRPLLPKRGEVDVLLLPEAFATGFATQNAREVAAKSAEAVEFLAALAAELDCAVGASVFAPHQSGKVANRFFWVEPDGRTSTADKRHLFAVAGEHQDFSRGEDAVVVTWRGWRLRLAVCFDLRFPVWLRNTLDSDGSPAYDGLLVLANWPEARENAWTTLLAARAMENQCYVAGVNRIGIDGFGVDHSGASRIFGPWGDLLAAAPLHEPALVTAVWDSIHLAAVRKRFPFLADQDPFAVLGMPQDAKVVPPSNQR